ncbi:protein kinase [Chitinophaga sancti]|uniref:protein kinase domain-containing protein n=1 Tax=Chitinophaga sancti TaxID=1004 RepID=UPI002A762263|nr:lanthionine synthetase LanC family protein [Chitinophaga sancti]WPQ63355.1 protein kinase [Chitinophaga sancti]
MAIENSPNLLDNSSRTNSSVTEYEALLESFGVKEVVKKDWYLQVGQPAIMQGWMIHISIWDIHFYSLASLLFPYLLDNSITFLIPLDSQIHQMLQAGAFGYKNLGKIIIIYPRNNYELNTYVKKIIELTREFKGPAIPTDFHLGNLVYTRYGSFLVDTTNSTSIIKDPTGKPLIDEETIPPQIYKWISWPFNEIMPPKHQKTSDILNGKYLIREVLKPDAKGSVIKAMYQKKFWAYRNCIIKEGKKGMGVDKNGRDIKDRLVWQQSIYNKLRKLNITPAIIDFFEENENTYLVFEYINGQSLNDILVDLYSGKLWDDLEKVDKLKILDILIQFVGVVFELHKLGYVHRDLNAGNIYIDKNNKVWLLDLELTYDLNLQLPDPPYEKGTEGYMSPEQKSNFAPTIEQDIYSLGAVMLFATVHISPHYFNTSDNLSLKDNLSFFNSDKEIVDLICGCLDHDKSKRPALQDIQNSLRKYREEIQFDLAPFNPNQPNLNSLDSVLYQSICSLSNKGMVSIEGYWSSTVSMEESFIGNSRLDRTIYIGFRKGISGVLYLIGKAALMGVDIECCSSTWRKNYKLLIENLTPDNIKLQPGLFTGTFGVAMGIQSLLEAGILERDENNLELLFNCLEEFPQSLDLANGISGYGISLLKCRDFLPEEFVKDQLHRCVEFLSKNQLDNGSWNFNSNRKFKLIIYGFHNGIAGIIWFLLSLSDQLPFPLAQKVGLKGLEFLQKNAIRHKSGYLWHVANTSKEIFNFNNGGYHLVLPFIKAYKITQKNLYRQIAESTLKLYPIHVVSDFSSIERGLAGLGEVYLEAWLTFNNKEWLERADWIAGHLLNTIYRNQSYAYWIQFDPYNPHADLLTGNSGIIHFLLRVKSKNKMSYFF